MSSYLIYEQIVIPSIYCFLYLYLISFVIVIRREDWFLVWLGLEINIISFLILIYKRYRIKTGESCLKYFFIQRIRSSLFIRLFYLSCYFIEGILLLILSLKIGAGPFFFWFPSLCSGLDWFSCYMLILFQKVLPIMLILIFVNIIIWIIIIIRLILGVLGSFNQNNIKRLIAYSSIHHLGWIFILGINKDIKWLLYIIMYILILWRVVILFINDDIVDLSIIFISKRKLLNIIGMLRIGGVPPLLGFFLKWIALVNVINISLLYLYILIIVSIVILYVYIRIVYDIFMISRVEWRGNLENYLYLENYEVIRVIGIIVGIILFVMFV